MVDAADDNLISLFTEVPRVWFPKYGTAVGREQFGELAQGLLSSQAFFKHDVDSMLFTVQDNRVAVEGLVTGQSADGRNWPAHPRNEGRYCNVFEFDGPLICRLNLYEDPDFLSEDTDRLWWG